MSAGRITWAAKDVDQWPLGTFGYLPEERGLYPHMQGRDQLRFFAQLHGLTRAQADEEIAYWKDRLALDEVLGRKTDDLSKGNAQIMQFLAAVIHRPALVILDEPFSGLDPVNARLFKQAVKHLNAIGSTVLFSSHQMDSVLELCDRVCLIAEGRTLVHGTLDQVRRGSGNRVLTLRLEADGEGSSGQVTDSLAVLEGIPGLRFLEHQAGQWRYSLGPDADIDAILHLLAQRERLRHFSVDYPSLEDVYIAEVSEYSEGNDAMIEGALP
jgi:ABC-2 type transport system ATP-binding protein